MPGIVSVGILVALLFTLPSFAADANKDLCKAASEWDVATVRALLAEGTDVNGKCPDGTTPLLKAAAGGITGVVEALLAQGADVKARDSDNRLSLLIGVVKDQVRFVREVPVGGQRVGAIAGDGWTALMSAALNGHGAVVQSLLNVGADANAADSAGFTALMAAALNAEATIIGILLDKGADVNAGTHTGLTALKLAAGGDTQAVNALLAKFADPNLASMDGQTAFNGRLAERRLHHRRGSLGQRRQSEHSRQRGPNGLDGGGRRNEAWTFSLGGIALRPEAGHLASVRALTARGADVGAKAKDGRTALRYAEEGGNAAIVELLKKVGAKQ